MKKEKKNRKPMKKEQLARISGGKTEPAETYSVKLEFENLYSPPGN